MTTERIDHVAEAQGIMHDIDTAGPDDNLPMDWAGATEDEQWLVHASLRQAHVHSTLALVEQQRIANLIAFSQDIENAQVARDLAAIEAKAGLGL